MELHFKNISTGEVVGVHNLRISNDGRIFYSVRGAGCGTRFFNRNTFLLYDGEAADGSATFLRVADGWELLDGEGRRRRATKASHESESDNGRGENTKASEPDIQPTTTTADNTTSEADNEAALIAALRNLRGGRIDEESVRRIIADELQRYAAAPESAKVVKLAAKASADKNAIHCEKYARILAKVARGNNVYLYGRAGSGKSHTAEQIAADLGLEFYGQTTIQFAHDVRGYGDAGGRFQETPFYKAFANGGLYFQDEYDRSNAEAAIVLNSALANGWYDFPIVGRVVAHPKFRFMAAGNTTMSGGDEEYITGQVIDASSRDRFAFFFEVDYNHEVELKIAHNNTEIVAFVEAVREAIKQAGIRHVVSYRATAAMVDEVENENDKIACCEEAVFKGLERDAIREIYNLLPDTFKLGNDWAKAMRKVF